MLTLESLCWLRNRQKISDAGVEILHLQNQEFFFTNGFCIHMVWLLVTSFPVSSVFLESSYCCITQVALA